jgi:hypothetical protein
MSDPFKIDGPTCISLSGGRTSAYMLRRVLDSNGGTLPKETAVCFANTGKEDHRTLLFVEEIARAWRVRVHWVEFRDDSLGFAEVEPRNASEAGEPFAALIGKKKYLPNAVTRFCTSDLKIKPIEAFIRRFYGWGEFDMLVGIRADEPRRVAKMRHLHLPLAIAGVTKQDVLKFWSTQPFDLQADESNCDLCFLKGLPQIMSAIRKKPERAVWWARQEERIGARFAKDRPTYEQMRVNAINQQDAFGYDEEAIACFCGDWRSVLSAARFASAR